jgi:endonuclease YncB( thermonuclease family)
LVVYLVPIKLCEFSVVFRPKERIDGILDKRSERSQQMPDSSWPRHTGTFLGLLLLTISCASPTPSATPFPFTIEVGPFEPTLDISDCTTTICCSNCPAIPVHWIIDGDTFQSANATIRLYGVDTPERGEHYYDEATDRLRELAGDSVRVEFGPHQGDQYGRILYYVYNMDGESIDEMLVREGLALAWLEDGQHRNALLAVEGEAKEDGRRCLGDG